MISLMTKGTTWIEWNPEGSLLASCSRDGTVKIFDPKEEKIVKIYDNLHKGIQRLEFSSL